MSRVKGPAGDELPESAGPGPRGRGEDDVEESLHEALNDLEQMLERHEGGRGEHDPETSSDDDDPYTIPLLDEVVIPGVPVPGHRAGPAVTEDRAQAGNDEPALRRRLAARLASEVEVIVQDRVEAALEKARAEIAEQVRNHMDIILPEIVDELVHARRRGGA